LVTIFVFYKFPLLRLLLLLPIPSSVASPKFWDGLNIFDFKRATVFGVGHCLSKHKTASYAKNFWGPRPPLTSLLGTPMPLTSHCSGVLEYYLRYECISDVGINTKPVTSKYHKNATPVLQLGRLLWWVFSVHMPGFHSRLRIKLSKVLRF